MEVCVCGGGRGEGHMVDGYYMGGVVVVVEMQCVCVCVCVCVCRGRGVNNIGLPVQVIVEKT